MARAISTLAVHLQVLPASPSPTLPNGTGTVWSPLTTGLNGPDHRPWLSVDNTGNLYAGGTFTTAGGIPVTNIAKWNGTAWSPLTSGLNNTVSSLTFDNSSGLLYAGGTFTTAGGLTANHVAKWNGTAWSALAQGANGAVDRSRLRYPRRSSRSGGSFTTSLGQGQREITSPNGMAPLGLYMLWHQGANGTINALVSDAPGDIYIGGLFSFINGALVNKYRAGERYQSGRPWVRFEWSCQPESFH